MRDIISYLTDFIRSLRNGFIVGDILHPFHMDIGDLKG